MKMPALNTILLMTTWMISGLSSADPAQGNVNVNDTVTYEGMLTPASTSANKEIVGFIQSLTIASLDVTKAEYSVNEALFLPDGSEKDDSQTLATSDVKSRADMQMLLENCKTAGGTRQIIDVSGGTFDTCMMDDGKGNQTWLGDVPFNVVKQVSTDESKNVYQIEISLYAFGAPASK